MPDDKIRTACRHAAKRLQQAAAISPLYVGVDPQQCGTQAVQELVATGSCRREAGTAYTADQLAQCLFREERDRLTALLTEGASPQMTGAPDVVGAIDRPFRLLALYQQVLRTQAPDAIDALIHHAYGPLDAPTTRQAHRFLVRATREVGLVRVAHTLVNSPLMTATDSASAMAQHTTLEQLLKVPGGTEALRHALTQRVVLGHTLPDILGMRDCFSTAATARALEHIAQFADSAVIRAEAETLHVGLGVDRAGNMGRGAGGR